MPAVIEVEHLQKRHGDTTAVEDVTFDVQGREIFGLLAPTERARPRRSSVLPHVAPLWSGATPCRDDGGLRTISDRLPLTYSVRALQDPWVGRESPWAELGILVAIGLAAIALAARFGRRG